MTLMKRFLFLPLAFYAFSNLFAQITVTNERSINSAFQEYSPAFYGNGLVFVAANPAIDKDKKEDTQIGRFTTSIFLAKRTNEGVLQRPLPFAEELTTRFYDGPMSFNASGDVVFFTRSNLKKGKPKIAKDGKVKLKIYTATLTNSQWGSITELPFCDGEFDYAHPAVSADGRRLFFSSNRSGGQGGMDLYVSMNQNGIWGEPVNLGPKINTAKDEIFPYSHANGALLFSSNGRQGVGGLDVFYTKQTASGWLPPTALPEPINSTSDDFGLILNPDRTVGYFASNRASGLGDDDIYSVNVPNGLDIMAASTASSDEDIFNDLTKTKPSQSAGNQGNTEGSEKAKQEAVKLAEAKKQEETRLAEWKRKEEERKREEARLAELKRQEEEKKREETRIAEAKRHEELKIKNDKLSEQKRKEAEIAEQKRLEADQKEQQRVRAEIAEQKRKDAEIAEQKRQEARSAEQKKEETRLAEQKRLEAKLAEKKREEDRIAEQKRQDAAKEMKKREDVRLAAEKLEADKLAEQKRSEAKIAEQKRLDVLSAEQKREEAKIAEVKREEERLAKIKSEEERAAEAKRLAEAKIEEKKREQERISEQKREELRLIGGKQQEAKLAEQRREEARLAEQKRLNDKLTEEKREQARIEEAKIQEAKIAEIKKKQEARLAEQKLEEAKLAEQKRLNDKLAEEKQEEARVEEAKIQEAKIAEIKKKQEARLAEQKLEEAKLAEQKRLSDKLAEEKREKVRIEEAKIQEAKIAEIKKKQEIKLAEQKREEARIEEGKRQDEVRMAAIKREETRMAEVKRQEDVRLAEAKRQEEIRIAEAKREEIRVAEAKRQEEIRVAEAKRQEIRVAEAKRQEEVRATEAKREEIRIAEAKRQEEIRAKEAEREEIRVTEAKRQEEIRASEAKRQEQIRIAAQKQEKARLAEAESKKKADNTAFKTPEPVTNNYGAANNTTAAHERATTEFGETTASYESPKMGENGANTTVSKPNNAANQTSGTMPSSSYVVVENQNTEGVKYWETTIMTSDKNTNSSLQNVKVGIILMKSVQNAMVVTDMNGKLTGLRTEEGNPIALDELPQQLVISNENGRIEVPLIIGERYLFNFSKVGYEPKFILKTILTSDNRVAGQLVAEKFTNSKPSIAAVGQSKKKGEQLKKQVEQPKIQSQQPKIAVEQPRIQAEQPRIAVEQPRVQAEQPRMAVEQANFDNTPINTDNFGEIRPDISRTLTEGRSFELNNIYYGYGDAELSDNTKAELEPLIGLMLQEREMEIEVAAHTDSRGKAPFNLNLSQLRAENIKSYLVERGIAPDRVRAIGFGETRLKNRCADNVDCPEEEHQINRRTEIRVIDGGEPVNVRPKPNYTVHKTANTEGVILADASTSPAKYIADASKPTQFLVVIGTYAKSANAEKKRQQVIASGFVETELVQFQESLLYGVSVRKFDNFKEAQSLVNYINSQKEFEAFVKELR